MKLLLLTAVAMLTTITATCQATTHVVSNMPGFPAKFSDLQAAINSADVKPGDILLVQGSQTSYGDVTVNKRLTILGPGYFLSENKETQTLPVSAKLNSIIFEAQAAGSILQGMDITGYANRTEAVGNKYICYVGQASYATYSIEINANNVSIISNQISNAVLIQKVSGIIIRQNYVYIIYNHPESGSVQILNNIIYGALDANNASILQNSFMGGYFYCTGCNIQNNLINTQYWTTFDSGCQGWLFLPEVSTVEFNLLPANYPTTGTTNMSVADWGFINTGSTDGRFSLKPNSPAIGSGRNGTDIGHTGGATPYKLSGISLHPNIYSVTMPNTATSGSGLKIEVKVRAND